MGGYELLGGLSNTPTNWASGFNAMAWAQPNESRQAQAAARYGYYKVDTHLAIKPKTFLDVLREEIDNWLDLENF